MTGAEEKPARADAGEPTAGDERAPVRTRFWIFLVGVGAGLAALGGHGLRLGWETARWPRVEAEIVSSDVTVRVNPSSSGTPTIGLVAGGRRDEFASYAASFRYSVDGVEHVAHGIERGDLGLQNSQLSRDLGLAHPIGSRAMVAVDPADPDDAYLVPGLSSAAKMVTGVGMALLLIGLWVRAVSRVPATSRARRRRRR